jgi:TetR/AcrR family transcriptional regulator
MGITERKEREREARRNAILDATEQVVKGKGFATATMDDIAKAAELAKGTVYLYYKSKEELMVGLMIRGNDILYDVFTEEISQASSNFEKLLITGDAYWKFANEHAFYFSLHLSDHMPSNFGQVNADMIVLLQQKSTEIWQLLVDLVEGAKAEGMVRAEVDSFSVAMLLWLNSMSVLRMHHKIKSLPNNVYANAEGYNPCNVDFKSLYDLNGTMMMHEIATPLGLERLGPISWPHNTMMLNSGMVNCTKHGNISIGTFAEDALVASGFEAGL